MLKPNSCAAGAAVSSESSQSCCRLVQCTRSLATYPCPGLGASAGILDNSGDHPFSSLIQSIMLALAWLTVRMHLFPGRSIPSNKSLTVPQCTQILNQARTFGYLDTCSPEIRLPYMFILMGCQKQFSDLWSPWVCSPKGSLLLIPEA